MFKSVNRYLKGGEQTSVRVQHGLIGCVGGRGLKTSIVSKAEWHRHLHQADRVMTLRMEAIS